MKLAMAVGEKSHYRIDGIHGRHFIQTAQAADLSKSMAKAVIEEIAGSAGDALERVKKDLPARCPRAIHASVNKAVAERVRALAAAI